MNRIQTFFFPPGYAKADTDLQRRIRLAVNISLAFLLILLVFPTIYWLELENRMAVAAAVPAFVLFASLLFLLRSGKLVFETFANILIAVTVLAQTANICVTGGPTSIFIAGYIDILIMAALLVGRRATYIWTTAILAAPLTLGLLELQGIRLPYTPLDAGSPQTQLAISMAIIIAAALFVILLKSGLDSTLLLLHRRNKELAIAHEENLRMEKLAAELAQQRSIDALRARIAQDLHDDIGSTLSAINIYSSVAAQQEGDTIPLLKKISESSGKVMETMSDIVWDIHHSSDSFEEVLNRVREYAATLFDTGTATLHFDFEEEAVRVGIAEIHRKDFYLLCKEALANVAKYAGAANVWLSLARSGSRTTLSIRDDGRGFDTHTAPRAGNGLKNMAARAAAVGGALEIKSAPEKGSEVWLEM